MPTLSLPLLTCAVAILTTACSMLASDRVEQARTNQEQNLKKLCKEKGLSYPLKRMFIRAFKEEKTLELWGSNGTPNLTLIKTYAIAAQSGVPGPKRKEGDLQVPEGFYKIDRFNPKSQFHLSLGIDYPNASDRVRSDQDTPGGDIFTHGDRKSIGCLAMTDPLIEEIYLLALGAKAQGIPVHIFPCRMKGPLYTELKRIWPDHRDFWGELAPIYEAFEKTKQVPKVKITETGEYSF